MHSVSGAVQRIDWGRLSSDPYAPDPVHLKGVDDLSEVTLLQHIVPNASVLCVVLGAGDASVAEVGLICDKGVDESGNSLRFLLGLIRLGGHQPCGGYGDVWKGSRMIETLLTGIVAAAAAFLAALVGTMLALRPDRRVTPQRRGEGSATDRGALALSRPSSSSCH